MDNSAVTSAYVVHTQFLGLGNRPFPVKKGALRSVWESLFNDTQCFYKSQGLIRPKIYSMEFYKKRKLRRLRKKAGGTVRPWTWVRTGRLASKPFIPGVGPIFINKRSTRLNSNSKHRRDLYSLIRWNPSKEFPTDEDWQYHYDSPEDFLKDQLDIHHNVFGYDYELKDQRMNTVYFEGARPIFLRAETGSGVRAEGKIFIHIYPSGYVALILAVSLNSRDGFSFEQLLAGIQETRPWRTDNNWKWSSRIRNGSLPEVIAEIKQRLRKSFYKSSSPTLRPGDWQSAIKIASTIKAEQTAEELLMARDQYKVLNLQNRPRSRYRGSGYTTSLKYMLVSRQGLVCVAPPDVERRKSLQFFWKIMALTEFVAFKQKVYEDYFHFLKGEIGKLKDFRLSLTRKATNEDVLKFSVYDHKIPQFLSALDSHINNAAPFHRRIYSEISAGTGFDERRQKVSVLVKEWEEEVAKWEHGLSVLWRKIISPLRSLLASK